MDAERAVADHLNASSLGANAYYDVPSARPGSFVTVELTGGPRGECGTSAPMLDVTCWAESRRDARELAERVERALEAMPGGSGEVAGAAVTSTFRDRDLESGTPRYHVVLQLYCN